MPSEVKLLLTAQLTEELKGLKDLILADTSTLTAGQNHALRGKLNEVGVQMRVVKNRLVTRAFQSAGISELAKPLDGPTSVLFGGDGAPSIARLLKNWNRKQSKIGIKGGLLEGRVGTEDDVKAWAELPSREELLSMILGGILSPATGLAGAFQATMTQFVGCVAAHVEKLEKE
ncbi:MAG: 50S ribosomal protein L10 [Planctomycetota bacterium]|jgi:large subunit ribosomal protein L10